MHDEKVCSKGWNANTLHTFSPSLILPIFILGTHKQGFQQHFPYREIEFPNGRDVALVPPEDTLRKLCSNGESSIIFPQNGCVHIFYTKTINVPEPQFYKLFSK